MTEQNEEVAEVEIDLEPKIRLLCVVVALQKRRYRQEEDVCNFLPLISTNRTIFLYVLQAELRLILAGIEGEHANGGTVLVLIPNTLALTRIDSRLCRLAREPARYSGVHQLH